MKYAQVYPGVDLIYYGNQKQLEYDFIVAPGADSDLIRMRFSGAQKIEINSRGELVLHTRGGQVVQHAPVIYQEMAGERRTVQGRYKVLSAREVGFSIGEYDHDLPLVIDPVVEFSTYIGGSGSDSCRGITSDSSGNLYITGLTNSTNLPAATNAFGGGYDAFVTKLSSAGSVLFSTYVGGSGDDAGDDIASDSSGNLYITGYTGSTNLPAATNAGSGGLDAFVTKLSSTGSVLFSTYVGGSGDDYGDDITNDSSGNLYITGYTGSTNLPASTNAFGGGNYDAFVTKLSVDSVASTLALSANPTTFSEAAGANAATGTITRSGDTTNALTVTLSSSNTNAATVPATVTIPAGRSAVTFAITAVDNFVVDGSKAVTITASAAGLAPATAIVTVTDNDVAGITVNPTSGLTTTEAGGQSTFSVRLNSQPTANVTIPLSSSRTSEGAVSPASLTFTPQNWNVPQTVTITGVDDAIADGNQAYTIVTAPAQSSDANYNTRNAADVSVTNTDNDTAALTLTLSADSVAEGATLIGTVRRNTPTTDALAVALTASDAASVTLPASVSIAAGASSADFTINVPDNQVAEANRSVTITAAANGLTTSRTLSIIDNDTAGLSLSLSANTAVEGSAVTGTVTRNTPTGSEMIVSLSSNNTDAATVPTSVTIAASATIAEFTIQAVDDAIADGAQTATITASSGSLATAQSLTVTDNDTAALVLSLPAAEVTEGGTITGRITRNTPSGEALDVGVQSSGEAATVPSVVIIAAGATFVDFSISAPDDTLTQGNRVVTITATSGSLSDAKALTVVDNETPQLQLTLSAASIAENATAPVTGTVSRNTATTTPLVVALSSSDTGEARVPANVTIPAGATSATFAITPVDDLFADGPQRAAIRARSGGFTNAATAVLTVTDNEVPSLTLTLNARRVTEGGKVTATLSRNTQISGAITALSVTLGQLPTRQFQFASPATASSVVIRAGKASVTFPLTAINNTVAEGPRLVVITAAARGFAPARTDIVVVDNEAASFGTIGGKVLLPATLSALPVPGVTLTLRRGSAVLDTTTTAANGTYSFRGLPRGSYTVTPLKASYVFAPTLRTVTLTATSMAAANINFSGTPRAQIGGTITRRDAGGKVLPMANVVVLARSTMITLQTRADSQGRYLFDRAPLGTYLVAPVLPGTFFNPKLRTVTLTAAAPVATAMDFVAAGTDTVAPARVVVSQPSATSFSESTKSTLVASGTAADNSGGSGLAVVMVTIGRFASTSTSAPNGFWNWSGSAFITTDNPLLVETPSTGTATWSLGGASQGTLRALPSGFYGLRATAVDNAGNIKRSTWKRFSIIAAQAAAARDAEATPSRLALSSGAARVQSDDIVLIFSGALDAQANNDASKYRVQVNGEDVEIESVSCGGDRITLGLPQSTLRAGDRISLAWQGLFDSGNRLLNGQTTLVAR